MLHVTFVFFLENVLWWWVCWKVWLINFLSTHELIMYLKIHDWGEGKHVTSLHYIKIIWQTPLSRTTYILLLTYTHIRGNFAGGQKNNIMTTRHRPVRLTALCGRALLKLSLLATELCCMSCDVRWWWSVGKCLAFMLQVMSWAARMWSEPAWSCLFHINPCILKDCAVIHEFFFCLCFTFLELSTCPVRFCPQLTAKVMYLYALSIS